MGGEDTWEELEGGKGRGTVMSFYFNLKCINFFERTHIKIHSTLMGWGGGSVANALAVHACGLESGSPESL